MYVSIICTFSIICTLPICTLPISVSMMLRFYDALLLTQLMCAQSKDIARMSKANCNKTLEKQLRRTALACGTGDSKSGSTNISAHCDSI